MDLWQQLLRPQKQRKDSNCNQKRTVTHKEDNKNKSPSGRAGGIPSRDKKKNYRLNIPPPTHHQQDKICLLNQFPPPIILMEEFNAYNA